MKWFARIFILLALSWSLCAEMTIFADKNKQDTLDVLYEEVRCLVCQNQNLKDSKAELASDLKQLIYEQVEMGKNKEEILFFLKERYGDFVHYEPPKDARTFALWWMPWLWLVAGLCVWFLFLRRQSRG